MVLTTDDVAAQLRAAFPRALREGQVVSYFQPEIELRTGRLAAAELLARWEHPQLGTLEPALFTPIAEELGLMGELSLQMLRTALAQHRDWDRTGLTVPVSVNIGPACVADPAFPAVVVALLREEQVPGPMLTLEVSEETGTAVASTRFFARLAESGIRISLDDFGTGFASLESLGGWPISELKLDRSIVRPMTASGSFATIVRTTIDLAHQLGFTVVAEGIETETISSELRSLGCDIGQGFLFGRPMPAADFTGWMLERRAPAPQRRAVSTARAAGDDAGRSGRGAIRRWAGLPGRAVRPAGGATVAALAVMLAAYGLWQVFRWGGRGHQALIGDLAFLPVCVAAVLLAWRASRRADLRPQTRRAWRLISAALCLFLLGDLAQLVYEVPLHRRAYPSLADAAYLSFYVIAFAGLMSFPGRPRSGPERLRLLLDVGTVFTAGVVAIWYLAISPALAGGAQFRLADLVTYAYPVGDLLILFGALSALWRGVPRSSVTALRLFTAGMLVFIAGDLIYDYQTVHSGYLGGDPVDTLWMVALSIFCLAAACQLRTRAPTALAPPPRTATTPPTLLTYLAVAGSYLLLVVVGLQTIRSGPLDGLLLGAAVLVFLVSARQYTALRDFGRLALRYQELAAIDGMTGLYNRNHFMETAEATFAHAERLGHPLTALMIDVDQFKRINDVHGHAVGDRVLAELAQSCREHVRPGDIVGRYGGDEFTIIVPGITSLRAIQIATRLTRAPSSVTGSDGKPLSYSVSIGIAECPPGGDLATLLINADLAMYDAKKAGGGGWRIFGEPPAPNGDRARQGAARPAPEPEA